MRLANGTLPWPWIDPDKALPWVEGRIGLSLAESQAAAIRLALTSKVHCNKRSPRFVFASVAELSLTYARARAAELQLLTRRGIDPRAEWKRGTR